MEEDERQWSDLPELILHAIATRLPGPADLLTFAGVCRSWRSVSYFSSVKLFSSLPRPIFCSSLFPYFNHTTRPPLPTSLYLYSPQDECIIYKYHSFAGASNLLFIGQSNGHFIVFDQETRSIFRAINPFSGVEVVFPTIRSYSFNYVILTEADTAHPNCRLVLISKKKNLIFCCLANGGQWQTINFWPNNLTDVISYKGRLYLVRCFDQVFEYDFGANPFHELAVRSPIGGKLMESPDGDLVMLQTCPAIAMWRVMLAQEENENADADGNAAAYDDHSSKGRIFEWPAGKTLMFRCQRSDYMFCPKLATMHKRRKVVVMDMESSFWRNYLDCSPPSSNGVYVLFDNCGRPTHIV